MPTTASPPQNRNRIAASVQIRRPVDEVFAFYRDFRNLPRFLGDVMAIEPLGPDVSRWTIQGPFGVRTYWMIRLTEERSDALIRYQTIGLPGLTTSWDIQFGPGAGAGETEVRETMRYPLGALGRAALALIGKFPAKEVSANLHRLKQVMETGKVTDTDYAVPGKFPGAGA